MFLKGTKEQLIQINNTANKPANKQTKITTAATGSKKPVVVLIWSPIETDPASGQKGI